LKALVLFDTLFGNTGKIAGSLAKGLREKGVEVECFNIASVRLESIPDYDLLAVGAPTRAFTAAKPMKDFLPQLASLDLHGKMGFAFDTRIDNRLSGSAAKYIEGKLEALGIKVIRPRASAFIKGKGPSDGVDGTSLMPGMSGLFEAIGREIGDSLKGQRRPPATG
jgi:flavorubredoxin